MPHSTPSLPVSAAVQWVKDDGLDGWVKLRNHDTTYKIITPGSGPAVSIGARVTVHAIGIVADSGRLFWSTTAQGEEPYTYTAGVGDVILGWDKVRICLCRSVEGFAPCTAHHHTAADW